MATTLNKIEMKDRYHGALRDMIDAKVKGKEIVTVVEEEKPVVDIMSALKESIEQARTQKKPMVKAVGKKKAAKKAVKKAKPKTAAKAKTRKRRSA